MPMLPPILLELQAKAGEALAALDEADRRTAKLGTEGSSHMAKFQTAGHAALLAFGGATVAVGGFALEMADRLEPARVRLEGIFANLGTSFDAQKTKVSQLEDRMASLGFANNQVEDSVAGLAAASKSPTKAMQDMALAADIARGRHIDLSAATQILMRVETGHVSMLSRLGIATKDASGHLLSQHAALAQLSKLYAGDASRYTDTFKGKMDALRSQTENLAARFGLWLIPKLEEVMSVTQSVIGWFEKHKTTAEALGIVVGTVLVGAIGAYVAGLVVAAVTSASSFAKMLADAAAWAAETAADVIATVTTWMVQMGLMEASAVASAGAMLIAWAPILLGLAAIGVAAYELYTHWSTVWGGIKAAAEAVAGFFVNTIWHGGIEPALHGIEAAIKFVGQIWSDEWLAIRTVVDVVWGALKTVFDTLVHGGLGLIRSEIQGLETIWHAVWGGIQSVVSTVWGTLSPVFHDIAKVGLWYVEHEIALLRDLWHDVWLGIQTVVEGVWKVLQPIFDTIKKAIGDITGGIGDVVGIAGKIGGGVGKLFGFASGTNYAPGGLAMVGERGPEVMYVPRGAEILNAGDTTRMLANTTGATSTAPTVIQTTIAPSITVTGNLDQVTLDQVEDVATAIAVQAAQTLGDRILQEHTAGRR